MKRLLFVCLGNICRSPTAEAVMQSLVDKSGKQANYYCDSAGTSAHHEGENADSRMISHGKKRGFELTSISRGLVPNDFENFDYIFAMDHSNYENILDIAPTESLKNKVYRIMDFSEKFNESEVPDPYYGGAAGFELVIDMLEDACSNLFRKLDSDEL